MANQNSVAGLSPRPIKRHGGDKPATESVGYSAEGSESFV
jgi:hypothetical protein